MERVLRGIVTSAAGGGEDEDGRVAADAIEEAEGAQVGPPLHVDRAGERHGPGTDRAEQKAMPLRDAQLAQHIGLHEAAEYRPLLRASTHLHICTSSHLEMAQAPAIFATL